MKLEGKKVLVVGAGKSGIAASELLLDKKIETVLYDGNKDLDVEKLYEKAPKLKGMPVLLGELTDEQLRAFDVAVLSPGVPTDLPVVERMRAQNVCIWGEIELAYSFAKGRLIAITGTNGKTTTNAILCKALEHEGQKVIINRTGANMLNGIISAFVLATDKHGNLDADYACIEVDEIASVGVLPKIEPDCALLTNISRDQLDRFGEVDITYNKLMTAVTSVPKTTLIINCDDILSYSLAQESKNAFVTYGISEQIFDDVSRSEIRESIFCRKCGKKLEYQFFHYGQLGLYHCPNCGWNRPNPEYTAEHVVREDELYSFDMDGIHFDPQIRTPYNIYNTLSAYAALKTMGAGYEHFKEMIEAFDYGNNRESIFNINGARVQLHLAIGFQQKVSHVLRDPNPKDIIIQINDTYQDGEDVSWLWDVDFQYLAESNARKIITAGTRKYDMALRLKYEDVSCESTDDMRASVLECVEQGTKNLYVIVNYSGLYQTNHMLTELEGKGGTER